MIEMAKEGRKRTKVKGALLLDVVVGEGATVFQLLSGEDEALLIRGDSLLVLDSTQLRRLSATRKPIPLVLAKVSRTYFQPASACSDSASSSPQPPEDWQD